MPFTCNVENTTHHHNHHHHHHNHKRGTNAFASALFHQEDLSFMSDPRVIAIKWLTEEFWKGIKDKRVWFETLLLFHLFTCFFFFCSLWQTRMRKHVNTQGNNVLHFVLSNESQSNSIRHRKLQQLLEVLPLTLLKEFVEKENREGKTAFRLLNADMKATLLTRFADMRQQLEGLQEVLNGENLLVRENNPTTSEDGEPLDDILIEHDFEHITGGQIGETQGEEEEEEEEEDDDDDEEGEEEGEEEEGEDDEEEKKEEDTLEDKQGKIEAEKDSSALSKTEELLAAESLWIENVKEEKEAKSRFSPKTKMKAYFPMFGNKSSQYQSPPSSLGEFPSKTKYVPKSSALLKNVNESKISKPKSESNSKAKVKSKLKLNSNSKPKEVSYTKWRSVA
ncbi:hypothetical protein RFI_30711 [Reticulomyxa filosa]|uniref:Uncharacterized protein n=1 Tax=Reticulomyxa filosa TaxID=46433 RepID=X6M123_RETFI|nr:hypothetical protein RFI_30711 [Reticulomyxa filosa]|eukprot:ETO06680.1 hypothetical protein RFI_30711 [Reticulomyxa filosa]